jgi:signal transduction histidine kinase
MDIWQAISAGLVGLCIGLVLVALGRLPDSRLIRPLLCVILTVALWSLGELVASHADDMARKHIGLLLLYTGTIFLPACWWTLAVRWAQELKNEAYLTRAVWLQAPWLWAGAMWLVMLSNPLHGSFLTPVLGGRNEYGPLWWVMALPNYALVLAAGVLLIQASWRTGRPAVRWQAVVLVGVSGFALLSNWVFLLGSEVRPTGTLLVFAIAGAILALGMYRQSLFGVLPAALPVIFEHDPDGLLVVRPGGRLVHCNRSARELLAPVSLGVGARIPHDLPGLFGATHAPPADRGDAEAGNADLRWWLEVLTPGGRVFSYGPEAARSLHVSGHAVRGRRARIVALALRVRDVTAEQEAQASLRRTRRLESVAELARGVAHDFHNMLGVVRGNARLLVEDLRGHPEVERRVERILRFGRRATDLADQLELYAGGAEPVPTVVDLNEIVRDTADGLEPEPGAQVGLRLDLCRSDPLVVGDATQLRQALLNLLVNAREVLQERGGVIRVSTGIERFEPSGCRGLVLGAERPSGRYAFVRVADDGPGIDLEAQERIFEPFVSSKGKHRGIGLSTVLGIARAHRALLRLESAPGRGSSFAIYLDVAGVEH